MQMVKATEPSRTRIRRDVARVVVLDEADAVLLLSATDSTDPSSDEFWFTPGGGIDTGESLIDAARREMFEETGAHIDDFGPVVFTRIASFHFEDREYEQHESYFVVHVGRYDVRPTGWTDLEARSMTGWRWWSVDELEESSVVFYPRTLTSLVRSWSKVAENRTATSSTE